MKHVVSVNDLKFCEAGNCGNCYSTCQSQYKDSSGMATHECENSARFEDSVEDRSKKRE